MSSEVGPLGVEAPAVRVSRLWKEFSFFRSPWDRLLEWGSGGRIRRGRSIVALRDISFSLSRGCALGVVGANGAGKSTLLKILCGTLYPSRGTVRMPGRVASLLELGMGFHPDFSGRQNIVFNARFMGLSDEEIRERMEAIISFSELGEDVERPLRTFSTGMQLRLAFAVVANVDPEILVIDEALAVGDAYFTRKCISRIRRFREAGVTLLFASHDTAALKALCDEALLLHEGRLLERGRPEEVLGTYNRLIVKTAGSREILALEQRAPLAPEVERGSGMHARRSGSFLAVVESVSLEDASDRPCRTFIAGEQARVGIRVAFLDRVEEPTVGVLIRDRLGNDIYGTNTFHQRVSTGCFEVGQTLEVRFEVELNLGAGEYSLTVAVHTHDTHLEDSFDWIDRYLVFRVTPAAEGKSIGPALLRPAITARPSERRIGAGDWRGVLAQVFGDGGPRRLDFAGPTRPWLVSGWYPPEESDGSAFAWTAPRCSFLVDLQGERLDIELGAEPQPDGAEATRVQIHVFTQLLGTFEIPCRSAWAVLSIPIPDSHRAPLALVRMEVPGWCPADRGLGADTRILGVRVKSISVRAAGETDA